MIFKGVGTFDKLGLVIAIGIRNIKNTRYSSYFLDLDLDPYLYILMCEE